MPLYGPFSVMQYAADGSLSSDPAPGVHYTADRPTWQAQGQLLGPYVVTPSNPLQFVMMGYEQDPGNTIPICFPDQATADGVIAQLV